MPRLSTLLPATRRLLTRSERGQTMVEYGLLISLIAVLLIVSITFLSAEIMGLFAQVWFALTGM